MNDSLELVGQSLASVALVAKLGMHGYVAYLAGVAACGALSRARPSQSPVGKPLRFAALVIAHDEENVVEGVVRSLSAQTYARDLFDVVVIADNCKDATAARARNAGATVVERSTGGAEGKSAALRFALEWVASRGGYDAIAVFDADNEADAGFLAQMDLRLRTGERVVQALVDAKNSDASWVAASSALGFWAIAAVGQEPREAAGLSASLMGTGWAARLDGDSAALLATESLTDDLELGATLALAGVRVAYEAGVGVVDEKPTHLRSALGQRGRWMQGRWAVARRWVPRLLRFALALEKRDAATRLRALDFALQLVAPSLLFTAVALVALGGLELLAGGTTALTVFGPLTTILLGTAYYVAPAFALRKFRPPLMTWACYLVQPFYLVLSAPLAIIGFLRVGQGRWVHTPHEATEILLPEVGVGSEVDALPE